MYPVYKEWAPNDVFYLDDTKESETLLRAPSLWGPKSGRDEIGHS
jgi:hypothetical protein